jgi:hypothetical protein
MFTFDILICMDVLMVFVKYSFSFEIKTSFVYVAEGYKTVSFE